MHAAEVAPLQGAARWALRGVGRAACVIVAPAALTIAASRWLVPTIGVGLPGVVAQVAHGRPLLWEAGFFVTFAAIARYWYGRAAGSAPSRGPRSTRLLAWVAWIGAACAGALLLRTVARPYRVEGASMLPTLAPNDLVGGVAHRKTATPRRGDIVVFGPEGLLTAQQGLSLPTVLVKRVVGMPGDRISMRGGSPVINGWEVPSCDAGDYLYAASGEVEGAVHGRLRVEFLDDAAYLTVRSISPVFPGSYLVPPGEVFVLGDDRGNSVDSRHFDAGRGRGVRIEAIEALVDRFLVGTHRSGEADLARFFRPVDALAVQLRLEGFATDALAQGVARCLANRPPITHAPPTEAGR